MAVSRNGVDNWILVARQLPAMQESRQRFARSELKLLLTCEHLQSVLEQLTVAAASEFLALSSRCSLKYLGTSGHGFAAAAVL